MDSSPAGPARPENMRSREAGGRSPLKWTKRNLGFIFRNRMYGPLYWLMLFRFIKFKLRHPGIKTEGIIFLPGKYEIKKGKGAKFTFGAWVWIGKGCALRAHEGTLRIGSKVAMGGNNTINCFESVEIGDECLLADNIYIADFDHWYVDPNVSIRSQGIRKEPVRIEPDVWIGEKVTVLRGVTVGSGSVVGAMSLVTRDVPEYAIAGGVPARVLKYRRSPEDAAWDEGDY
ncbi:MAG: acyltransferase [Actinobacteria bacterium]|nr:acyltransferase [Actinomycetota bacterium]